MKFRACFRGVRNYILSTSIVIISIIASLPALATTPETPATPAPKPWSRFLDARLVSGYPESLGLCGEWHPIDPVEVQLCAGLTRDIVTVSQAVKWSWNTVLERAPGADTGETSWHGLGLGVQELWACPTGVGCGLIVGPQLFYAYEHVWWTGPREGWELSVELGAGYGFTSSPGYTPTEVAVTPIFRFGFGRTF